MILELPRRGLRGGQNPGFAPPLSAALAPITSPIQS